MMSLATQAQSAERVVARLRTNRASQVVDADGAASLILRREVESIVGTPLTDFLPPADRPVVQARLFTLGVGNDAAKWRLSLAMPEGAVRIVDAYVVAVEDDPATLEWQLAESAAERAAAAAREEGSGAASASLPDVVAHLAHDLNQPLAAIVTYARGALLRSRAGTLGPGDLEQVLSIIVTEALRVADQIRAVSTRTERS